MVNNRADII